MEREHRKHSAFIMAFIVLGIATVIWALILCLHVVAYNRMVEASHENLEQIPPELRRAYIGYEPLFVWRNGTVILLSGVLLALVWLSLILLRSPKGARATRAKSKT